MDEKDIYSPSIEAQYIFLESRFFENHRKCYVSKLELRK